MGNYYLGVISAEYFWVRDNIQYLTGYKGTQTVQETLNLRMGKCDEMSTLLVSMLRSVGLDARIIILPEDNHALVGVTFNEANKINGQHLKQGNKEYLLLDPTCKYCNIGEVPNWNFNNAQILEVYEP